MKAKDVVVVRYLIEHTKEELNIRTVAEALRMDYKNTHSIVKRLEQASLIQIERFGQSNRLRLAEKTHPLIFEAEYQRREEVLKNRNLKVMLNRFREALPSKLFVLLLFGSYARKTQTKHSDIDLMFIVPNGTEARLEKAVDAAARILPLELHCLVFSEKQFMGMLHAKEGNVGKEAAACHVILYGIEGYYEMMQ